MVGGVMTVFWAKAGREWGYLKEAECWKKADNPPPI